VLFNENAGFEELDLNVLELHTGFFAISEETEFAHAAESASGEVNADVATEFRHEDTFGLNVRELTFFGFVMSVGNVVTHERGFTCECTFAGHFEAPGSITSRKGAQT
jgi:hypothetical protein